MLPFGLGMVQRLRKLLPSDELKPGNVGRLTIGGRNLLHNI